MLTIRFVLSFFGLFFFVNAVAAETYGAAFSEAIKRQPPDRRNETQAVEAGLFMMADQFNRRLPMMVDQGTRSDSLSPGPGRRLMLNYTLVNAKSTEIDKAGFLQMIRDDLVTGVCTSPDYKVFFDYGVEIVYSYRGSDGGFVNRVSIKPSDCARGKKTTGVPGSILRSGQSSSNLPATTTKTDRFTERAQPTNVSSPAPQETLIQCKLIDEGSRRFCSMDVRYETACLRTYRIDPANKRVSQTDSTDTFISEQWTDEKIAVRKENSIGEEPIIEVTKLQLNRLTGRMTEHYEYTNQTTGEVLNGSSLDALKEKRVRNFGSFVAGTIGRLKTEVLIGECKAVRPNF